MTLRSVLGLPRVKKRSSSSAAKRSSTPKTKNQPSWTASLARTKPVATTTTTTTTNQSKPEPPAIPVPAPPPVSNQSPLTNPLQIHSLILATMFDPLPANSAGLGSARIATALQFRAALAPVVSVAHFQAALLATGLASSPSAAERATAALVRRGQGRRLVVPTLQGRGLGFGGGGELFVLAGVLERLVEGSKSSGLTGEVKRGFVRWLEGNGGRVQFRVGESEGAEYGLGWREADALVRAGFLTAVHYDGGSGGAGGGAGGGKGLHARPEGRHAMVSLETVARAAAGSVAAAGGAGVLHAAGGTGGRGGPGAASGVFNVAVPGSGVFLKLASAALDHLADLLRKSQYREMSESDLREKWDGGIVGDNEVALAKKTRGEFTGVMPGRTKKWKEFHGLAFGWVLQEAVGAGLVEIFETRTVGRGVRLV